MTVHWSCAAIAIPGVRVGCAYRDGFGHVGTVLSLDDPAAWRGTLAFSGVDPLLPDTVSAHVHKCLRTIPGFSRKVPVAWSFGRVYWESLEALYPLPAGAP